MVQLYVNNAKTTLANPISATDTSIQVASGASFPNPSSGEFFKVTLDDGVNIEIIVCTARSGDTFLCQRGAEGTTPTSFLAGARVQNRLTAESLSGFADKDVVASLTAQVSALETSLSTNVTNLLNNLNQKANRNSDTLTGAPKSSTPALADNSTNIATTAFVKAVASQLLAQINSITFGSTKKVITTPTPTTSATGTFTVPIGVANLFITMAGGGGGGSAGHPTISSSSIPGSGGGAGGRYEVVIPVIPGQVYEYQVGGGGIGGDNASVAAGATGTPSWFRLQGSVTPILECSGGGGGAPGDLTSGGDGGTAGVILFGGTTLLSYASSDGWDGYTLGFLSGGSHSGGGGTPTRVKATVGGNGGNVIAYPTGVGGEGGRDWHTDAYAGEGYGSGGGGGDEGNGKGARGAPGILIIEGVSN